MCVGCSGDAACDAWESCADHRCRLRAGRCLDDAGCPVTSRCDGTRTCVLRPGRCDAGGGCEAWQACQASSCVVQAGRCDVDADCGSSGACSVDHVCIPASFDPAGVALWGTLTKGTTCAGAVAPVSAPAQALLGFGCGRGGPAALSPTGDLVYADRAGGPIRRFHHDAMAWDPVLALWSYPLATQGNDDQLVAGEPCAGARWTAWLLQAGSGAVRYACTAGAAWDWFDDQGARLVAGHRVFAWTAGDLKLAAASVGPFDPAAAEVLDAAGGSTPVTGLPAGTLLAARTAGETFQVALRVGGEDQLWTVGAAGAAAFSGTLAAQPAGFGEAGEAVLDAAGQLHQVGTLGGSDVVVRRPLAPAAALSLYNSAGTPAGSNDWWARPFGAWVRIDGGARLVAGP